MILTATLLLVFAEMFVGIARFPALESNQELVH
jgi:hypothetical protein